VTLSEIEAKKSIVRNGRAKERTADKLGIASRRQGAGCQSGESLVQRRDVFRGLELARKVAAESALVAPQSGRSRV